LGDHTLHDDPEAWFHVRAALHVETQLLFHLNQAGVFQHLDRRGPSTAGEMAEALGLVPHVLEVALDYVVGVDNLLERRPDDRFAVSPFGERILDRYGRDTRDGRVFNFFDVRAGAYGPVWAGFGDMLSGEAPYGQGVVRSGEHAANALYKSAQSFAPVLNRIIGESACGAAVEFGVETGLLEHVHRAHPQLTLHGVDRSEQALASSEAHAAQEGVSGIQWIQSDLFDCAGWSEALPNDGPGVFFTIHMHEFLAAGMDAVSGLLTAIRERYPGWRLIVLEQPRLPATAREELPTAQWLYSQANVLIHHLIRNGRILSDPEWTELLASSGRETTRSMPADFLDYRAYVVQL
jgi:hypothetical protein